MHRSLSIEAELSSPQSAYRRIGVRVGHRRPNKTYGTHGAENISPLRPIESYSVGVPMTCPYPTSPTPRPPYPRKFFFTPPRSPLMVFAVKLEVVVMPKRTVLDPQGVAVRNAVRELGLSNVGTVRVGKIIELEFTGEPDEAKLDEICRDLLSNQVIEDYRILGAALK
jgi:phosphoribosylformylglycinamidine synthase subunit PurS